ncbi:hypothetical protein BH20VER3_BH20VER3_16780 [soil metagenome]
MDLPDRPARVPGASRAPVGGLKLMLAILVVFALLAVYGGWEKSRRTKTETARILPVPHSSPAPIPNDN